MSTPLESVEASALPQTSTTPPKIEAWKWAIVWTMFLATMLNYMDRQTMASTQVAVRNEFHLSNEGYGKIEFWFGIAFAAMQLCSGVIADRFSMRLVYAGALLVWSAAGFFTGYAETIIALYACRMVLGIGESFNWVCAAGVVERIIPREARSLANGIFHGGASVGAALTPVLAWMIVGEHGENWRMLFQIVGAAGLIWAVLWFSLVRGERAKAVSNPRSHTSADNLAVEMPFIQVMKTRRFWIAFVFGTAVNLTWHFYRFWLSPLMTDKRGLNTRQLQWMLFAFFVLADVGSLLTGWATRRMIRGGMKVERARLYVMFGTSALCLISGPAAFVENLWIAIPLICVFGMGAMGGFISYFSMTQELSGPHTSRCLGILGALIWFMIAVMQWAIGWVVDQIHDYTPMLIAFGFLPMAGTLVAMYWPDQEAHDKHMGELEAECGIKNS